MACLALQPIANKLAQENKIRGLNCPVNQVTLSQFLSNQEMSKIRNIFGFESIYLWGTKWNNDGIWAKMIEDGNTLVLFREGTKVIYRGICALKLINEQLAMKLWGTDPKDGETWPLIYCMEKFQKIDIDAKNFNRSLGYQENRHWQRLSVITDPRASNAVRENLPALKKPRI